MKEERAGQRDEWRSRAPVLQKQKFSVSINPLCLEKALQNTHAYIHTGMQLHLILAHNLSAAPRLSAILPGQVMKYTQGQVTKIFSVASAREGSSVLTDGHSIPGPKASPEHCQKWD